MKKIILLALASVLALSFFTSCENDEIDITPIEYDKMIFPEPFTVWGGSVAEAITFMKPYEFSSTDITAGNATLADGMTERKYYKFYSGNNLYDDNKSKIVYKYCFDNLDGGLKGVHVQLVGHSQFKLDEVTIQFKNSGYHYDGLVSSQYYLFSNDNTVIKCYLADHSFVFAKKGDTNEIVWN